MVIRLLFLILLLVGPARADDILRVILPDERPVMGEMIRATVRGEYTGFIALEKMTFPDSPAYDWMQLLPDDWHEERVNGLPRQIFERQIAIFPRKAGSLSIGPVTHHLTKAEGASRQEIAVTSAPVSIAVAPYPAPGLPLAARNLKVTDELSGDPARIGDGETVQRRITITAENTMAHFLPPRPELREKWLISFALPERRETRLTEKGPLAFVQWEWSLRPITGEQGTLPPMRFSWFDLAKRELRGAITQPIVIGAGYLGANVGGEPGLGVRWSWIALPLAGLVLALSVAFRSQGFHWPGWRRWLPNPHASALRRAALGTDMMELRRVALDFAGHERAMGRTVNPQALQRLDRAIFAADAQKPDPAQLLRDLRA